MEVRNLYQQAEKHAEKANELALDAREKLVIYKQLVELLKRWEEMMSQNPITLWTILFVLMAVGEFLVSIDLYIDLLPRAPWIIPLVIIGFSVVISHWLAYKFIPGLREIEFDSKRTSSSYHKRTDDDLRLEINRKSNLTLAVGLVFSIAITIVVYNLSQERVEREIGAGMRIKGFGFYDALPVIFYIAEIITGVYVVYLLKRLGKSFKAWRIKKRFDKLVRAVAHETNETIHSFETAEKSGLDLMSNTISESIHIAFYRNKNCNPSDEENYIKEPQNLQTFVKFQLIRSDKTKPLMANVHVYSEYNYAGVSASDDSGLVEIPFSSFENDTIKRVVVEFSDDVNTEDAVIYKTGNDTPHRILFRE